MWRGGDDSRWEGGARGSGNEHGTGAKESLSTAVDGVKRVAWIGDEGRDRGQRRTCRRRPGGRLARCLAVWD